MVLNSQGSHTEKVTFEKRFEEGEGIMQISQRRSRRYSECISPDSGGYLEGISQQLAYSSVAKAKAPFHGSWPCLSKVARGIQ